VNLPSIHNTFSLFCTTKYHKWKVVTIVGKNQTAFSTTTDYEGYALFVPLVVIWEFIHKNYNYLYITLFFYFLPLL
jgi:hypothetical protein